MNSLPATISPQLGKLVLLLSSDVDGEVLAAARAIGRTLKSCNRDWHDLVAVLAPSISPELPPGADWRALARFCADRSRHLSEKELNFIAQIARYRTKPSAKQLDWLSDIVARLRDAATC